MMPLEQQYAYVDAVDRTIAKLMKRYGVSRETAMRIVEQAHARIERSTMGFDDLERVALGIASDRLITDTASALNDLLRLDKGLAPSSTKKHTTRSRCASSSKAKKKGARKARRRNRKKR